MARGKMSSGRTVGRPALGVNTLRALRRARPAYRASIVPSVVGRGSFSHPSDPNVRTAGRYDASDVTPKVIQS
jgi:hypothetical protein